MNRAELIELNLAAKKVAETTKAMLNERAAKEFIHERVVPSWKSADFAATANMTHGGPTVTDDAELLAWVKKNYPSEVETVVRIRPAFMSALMDRAAKFGDELHLPLDEDGTTVIPGMGWREGGEFSHMSVTTSTAMKRRLNELADAVRSGHMPLALPSSFHPDALPTESPAQPITSVTDDPWAGEQSEPPVAAS